MKVGLGLSIARLTSSTTHFRCCWWSPCSCVGHKVLRFFSEFQPHPPLSAGPARLCHTGGLAPVRGSTSLACVSCRARGGAAGFCSPGPAAVWQACLPGPWRWGFLSILAPPPGQLESALCLWASEVGGSFLPLPWW